MPARIDVLAGPDKGWRYTLPDTDVWIGQGPGRHVPLTDPSWPDGDLRVQVRHGGYLLTNLLPHPIYLDRRPVGANDSRTLHHGAVFQPTAATVLRFADAAGAELPADGGVIATPPPPQRSNGSRNAAAALLAAAAWYATAGRPAFDPAAATPHKLHVATLIECRPDGVPRAKLGQLQRDLVDAVYLDAGGRPDAARARYQAVRDLLTELGNDETIPMTAAERAGLVAAGVFVGDRLRATARRSSNR